MGKGSIRDEEAEVENLLNQLHDESLLNLHTNTHRISRSAPPDLHHHPPAAAAAAADRNGGLDDNLLIRFANLKSRPAPKSDQPTGVKKAEPDPDSDDDEEDEDALAAELEQRLKALKSDLYDSSSATPKSSNSSSSTSSSSSSSSSKRGFSPMKMIKQLSMGKRGKATPALAAEEELMDSVSKVMKSGSKVSKKKGGEGDEMLLLSDDLDVKMLKKELSAASGEEERLAREAQKVIEWAKDAARLQQQTGGGGGGGGGDVEEEELLTGLDDEDEDDAEDEDEVDDVDKVESPHKNKSKKKKKVRKWGFF